MVSVTVAGSSVSLAMIVVETTKAMLVYVAAGGEHGGGGDGVARSGEAGSNSPGLRWRRWPISRRVSFQNGTLSVRALMSSLLWTFLSTPIRS